MKVTDNPVIGSCDGTGAVINVSLGWIPSKVVVRNIEDAGSLQPILTWVREQSLVTAQDEGYLEIHATDSDVTGTYRQGSLITSGGISTYAGGTTLVYDATQSRWETTAGVDQSEVCVSGYHRRTASTDAAYKCFGDAVSPTPTHGETCKTTPGFVIGANANINADGEQVVWEAYR